MTASNPTYSIEDHIEHLEALESESIHIFREVAGSFERPAFLF